MKTTSRNPVLGSPCRAAFILLCALLTTPGALSQAQSQVLAPDLVSPSSRAESIETDAKLALRILTGAVRPEQAINAGRNRLRCASPLLKRVTSSLDDIKEPLRSQVHAAIQASSPCSAAGLFPFTFTSSVRPITVHYQSPAFAGVAAQTFQFAQDAWTQQVDVMGFTQPVLNASCGGDANLDIFLQSGAGSAYVLDFASNPATSWDDYACYMVIDPQVFGGALLQTTVWHEFNHMCQAGDDWWEVGASFEATSTFIEEIADDSFNDYISTLTDFASAPQRPFEYNDQYATFFMYGGVMQLLFLRDRYFAGSTHFLANMWKGMRSPERGCDCLPALNEPDALDAMQGVLATLGVSSDAALEEFSRWRWFVGSRDDGSHFEEGALWPDTAQPPILSTRSFSQLPVTFDVTAAGPWSHGFVLLKLVLDGAPQGAVRATFVGDPSTRWSVKSLRIGTPSGEQWIDRLASDGAFTIPATGASDIIMMIVNKAPLLYDPDFQTQTSAPFTLTLELAPPTADLNGDGAIDSADLATLLAQWGAAGSADLNLDGLVDSADLATLLANWG